MVYLIEDSEVLKDPIYGPIFRSVRSELGKLFSNHYIGRIKLEYAPVFKDMPPEDGYKVYTPTGISLVNVKVQIQEK